MADNEFEYDTTAGNNTDLDGETVGDTTRIAKVDNLIQHLMANRAAALDDLAGVNTVGGTADAITITTAQTYASLATGLVVAFKAGSANTGAATVNVDSLGAKAIRRQGDTALEASDILANGRYWLVYDASYNSAAGAWILFNSEYSRLQLLDEDDMSSNSATKVPSQQSVKAYVDSNTELLFDAMFLFARDEKSNGTDGGTKNNATWDKREIGTIRNNSISGASAASSTQITLPEGTYMTISRAPAYAIGMHKLRIYDNTNGNVLLVGGNFHAPSGQQTTADISGKFAVPSGGANVSLDHWSTNSKTTDGLGLAVSSGAIEVYAELSIWKVA